LNARRTLAATLLAALACPVVHAERIDVQPRWHVGEHLTYRMTETITAAGKGAADPLSRRQATIALDVVEQRGDGWLLTWRRVPPAGEASAGDGGQAAARRAAALPLTLRVDAHGRLLEVVNWEQVRDADEQVADGMRRFLAERQASPQAVAAIVDHAHARVASEAAVRASHGYEPQVLLATIGHDYDAAAPTELVREAPNPMGGPLVPATMRFELESLDAAANLASLRVTQRVDPAAMQGQVQSMMAGLTHAASGAASGVPSLSVSDVDMAYRASVDVRTGWPRTARVDLASRFNGVQTVQSTLFERE
jgi:hypothetical protein